MYHLRRNETKVADYSYMSDRFIKTEVLYNNNNNYKEIIMVEGF